ncbi:MAG: hypothetical protein R3316_07210 [Rhodovibrionaceae bacterium]|nr:hypothetical protein [Rhodovibrionaceae bacterium]
MTFCLGIKVRDGLVCLADGRVTSGAQVSNARKVSLHGESWDRQICIMTSGLRSVRDKTLAYFDRAWRHEFSSREPNMLEAVSTYAEALRRVAKEDKATLKASKLDFNLHTIVAGQLSGDGEPSMYLVYPEGNWIEVDVRTPYLSIGATAYGKPVLDRTLTPDTDIATALKVAYLSFDSTRVASADVGFPVDMLTYLVRDGIWREINYDYDDLRDQRIWWNENIKQLVTSMPDGPWMEALVPGGLEVEGPGGKRLSVIKDD